MSLPCFKKVDRDEIDFLQAQKDQRFLQVYFNTFGIKVSYKVILSLLMGMIKHSHSIQSNKFAISLHYLKKRLPIKIKARAKKEPCSVHYTAVY